MDIEQHFTQLAADPAETMATLNPRDLKKWIPKNIIRRIKRWMNWDKLSNLAVIEPSVLNSLPDFTSLDTDGVKNKIIIIKLNAPDEARLVEKHLLELNGCLPIGGCLLGCLSESTKQEEPAEALSAVCNDGPPARQPGFIKSASTMLIVRKWLARRFHARQDELFPSLETCGRLLAHGFRLLEVAETANECYFIAQKIRPQKEKPRADRGPVIRLKRVGQGGKPIAVYKFRTMYPYSEYLQEYIYERHGLQDGGKMNGDPRVTPLGRFLRKYWLDELPMLFNMLKGELKLFGVRPITEHYLSLYPEEFRNYRMRFKPGLIPPFYADLPKTLEEIIASEKKYLKAYEKAPLRTDLRYIRMALHNIICKGVRSG